MGNVDSVPVVSQTKSLVQAIGGDTKGAKQTQVNFSKGCPVVSQARSAVEVISGDKEAARDTQTYFLKNVENVIDNTPVIGHIKGGVHLAVGDTERGEDIMKAASRTTGVVVGGVGGFVLGGPPGAVVGGIAGGAVMDTTISATDSLVHKEDRPYGYYKTLDKAVDGDLTIGEGFDAFMMPVFDGRQNDRQSISQSKNQSQQQNQKKFDEYWMTYNK